MSYPILVERFDDEHSPKRVVCESCGLLMANWDPLEGDPFDIGAKCAECGGQIVYVYREADRCGGCGELGDYELELDYCCSRECMARKHLEADRAARAA